MKKILNKLVLGAAILGGIVYFTNNIQPNNELSAMVLKNLTVLNTASAEETTESGPKVWQTIDCGLGHGGHWVCMAETPNTSCSGTDCN